MNSFYIEYKHTHLQGLCLRLFPIYRARPVYKHQTCFFVCLFVVVFFQNGQLMREYVHQICVYWMETTYYTFKDYVEELSLKGRRQSALALLCHNGCIRKYNGLYLGIMDANTQRSCFVVFFLPALSHHILSFLINLQV